MPPEQGEGDATSDDRAAESKRTSAAVRVYGTADTAVVGNRQSLLVSTSADSVNSGGRQAAFPRFSARANLEPV